MRDGSVAVSPLGGLESGCGANPPNCGVVAGRHGLESWLTRTQHPAPHIRGFFCNEKRWPTAGENPASPYIQEYTMTDLELLRSTFDKLGVKYSIAEQVDKLRIEGTGEREYKRNAEGSWVWVGWKNAQYLDHDLRLDTEHSYGHAELAFFFTKDGKFVKQVGYEI